MRPVSLVVIGSVISGCVTSEYTGTESRDRYIESVREIAVGPISEKEDPDDIMTKPDWMVYPCTVTTEEYKSEYKVIYADRDYLSFRCEDYAYTGGAHGSTIIKVGTIDRKTGKILTLDDVRQFADRCALQKMLYDAVVSRIGKDALQGEVKPHDNFYLAKDGWHFVYNQYEVACYAEGAVEVTVGK